MLGMLCGWFVELLMVMEVDIVVVVGVMDLGVFDNVICSGWVGDFICLDVGGEWYDLVGVRNVLGI